MARPRRSHLSELDLQALIDEVNEDNDSDYRADSDIEISEDESHSGSPSIDLGESSLRLDLDLDLDPQTESERPGPSGDGPDHPDEWTYDMTGIGTNVRDFTQVSGPTHPLDLDAEPIEYFFLLFPVSFFDTMVTETNRYARQHPEINQRWTPVTVPELKAYLSIYFYMGIQHLSDWRDYWSTDEILNHPFVSNLMIRNRFEEINKNFHLADNTANPDRGRAGHNPLHRVQPILDLAKNTWPANFQPGKNLCVDEAMIKFKGRCPFLQYMPAKPTKWGIKAWAICDSKTFYMLDINIYAGKHNQLENPDRPLGDRVVLALTQQFRDKNHVVYFDNYFSSLPLFETLENNGLYGCGTLRTNRKGFPAFVKDPKCVKNPGDTVRMRKGNVQVIAWFDRRKVTLASNAHDASDTILTRRARPNTPRPEYSQPMAIKQYNLNYFGVDKNDQLRQYYSIASKAHKYWKYIFWFIVDVCAVNAYILYLLAPGGPRPKLMSHKEFNLSLVRSLAGNFTSRKRMGRPLKRPAGHELTRINTKRGQRDCVGCKEVGKKTNSGKAVQTKLECLSCGKALCRPCFETKHQ